MSTLRTRIVPCKGLHLNVRAGFVRQGATVGGDAVAPGLGLGVEVADVAPGAGGEEAVADIADGVLHASLLVAARDRDRPGQEQVVAGEGKDLRIEPDGVAVALLVRSRAGHINPFHAPESEALADRITALKERVAQPLEMPGLLGMGLDSHRAIAEERSRIGECRDELARLATRPDPGSEEWLAPPGAERARSQRSSALGNFDVADHCPDRELPRIEKP